MSKNKLLWYWLPLFVWMLLIFTFSAQPSLRISSVNWQDFIFRKIAHIIEYLILSYLSFRAFHYGSGLSRSTGLILAFFLTLIYAITDEFHQTRIPDRDGRLRDVAIDTIGNLIAVMGLSSGRFKRIEDPRF